MDIDNIVYRPILRLAYEQDFDAVPQDLQIEIQERLGIGAWKKENFVVKLISQKKGEEHKEYAEQFQDRIGAIHEGIVLLLSVFGLKSEDSFSQIAENCKSSIKEIKHPDIAYYQNYLDVYKKAVLKNLQETLSLGEEDILYYLSKAEEIALVKKPNPILCTMIEINSDYAVMIDKPENPLSDAIIKDFKAIKSADLDAPFWFNYLKPIEKCLIINMLSDINLDDEAALKTKINAFSSKLRIMPVLSNYRSHTLITKIKNTNLVVHQSEICSGHIGSRDVFEIKETKETEGINEEIKNTLRKIHAVKNLRHQVKAAIDKKLVELENSIESAADNKKSITIPILLQSFVTPIVHPDAELDEDKIIAVKIIQDELNNRVDKINGVEVKFEIVSTNHPLNIGRILCHTESSSETTGQAIRRLIEISRENNSGNKNKFEKAVCKDLEFLAFENDGFFSRFSDSRELHLAGLERMINSEDNGVSISFCVSGKDRTAVAILYANAMKIYYQKYGKLYQYDDTEENKNYFGKIFAKLYWSKHLQMCAGQNAPGSNGLQNLSSYLPAYLQAAIRAHSKNGCDDFAESNDLACNNEIKKIPKIKEIPDGPSLFESAVAFFSVSPQSLQVDTTPCVARAVLGGHR